MIAKEAEEDKCIFNLNDVENKWGEIRKFGINLINGLGDAIIRYTTHDELLYHILLQIDLVNKAIYGDHDSIERACKEVLDHFKNNEKPSIRLLTTSDELKWKPEKRGVIEEFCETIIEMCGIPSLEYMQLLENSQNDLKELSHLIAWYEKETIVGSLIGANQIPRNQEESKYYDFYKRCIDERINIINYQLYDIIKHSILKAKESRRFGEAKIITNDLPYKYSKPLRNDLFDCRKIDIVRHRLGEFYVPELKDNYELYYRDKNTFYKNYFERISVQKHFNDITSFISMLPILQPRMIVFNELEKLFNSKYWLGFYALALPQVEGIFNEMCNLCPPVKKMAGKSLPQKVDYIRPYFSLSDVYFDYFQYHIPTLRNKFSHTGFDEKFQLNSFDLLVDLRFILQVFTELTMPYVIINRFHNGNNPIKYHFCNRSRHYSIKTGSVVKTKHGRGKFTRISQKAAGNNQRARSANSRA